MALAVLALASLLGNALAQTPAPDQKEAEADLGDVVVTAQKREEKLQKVPLAITVLGGDSLQKSEGLYTANDITQLIPNAQASATDGRTRPRWFLRGIGTNETAPQTVSPIGIYNDDVYLNNVYIQGFPLFDTERVEVLRGPQGTLWGKNTTGGAIHYLSRRPKFKQEGYAGFEVGSFNERIVQGAVNGVLIEDVLAARVSVYGEKRDGWVPNTATGRRDGGAKDNAARLQLLWNVNNDIDALFNVHARKLDGDKSPSFYVLDPQGRVRNPIYAGPLRGRDEIAQAGEFGEVLDSDGSNLRLNWNIGGYTVTSITAYETGNRTLLNGSPIALETTRSRSTSDSRQTSQELRLTSPRQGNFDWIAGAYWFKETLDTNAATQSFRVPGASATNPANPSVANFNITNTHQDTRSTALFASGNYRFTDALSVTVGVRRSNESKDFNADYRAAPTGFSYVGGVSQWWTPAAVSGLRAPVVNARSKSWSETTWDITPQFKVNDNINTYLRYAHGFRAGGFVESDAVIRTLEPETLDATELGIKTQWLGGRLTFNTALFNYDYKDIIVGVLLPVPGSNPPTTQQVQENAAKGWARGAEFELSWAPSRQARLGASLGLLKTRYTNYTSSASGQSINANGNRFTRSPELSLGLNGEINTPLGSGIVGLGGDISWRSKQYFNAVDQTRSTLRQDAYTLANLRVFYRTADGKAEVAAFVRNVTDAVYSKLATNTTAGVTRQVYGLPRSYGISAQLRF
ncbi:MAG: TonB-dependent receptor [Rhizobacter sp.]